MRSASAALLIACGMLLVAAEPEAKPPRGARESGGDSTAAVPFAPGERLTYDVSFGPFRVGGASLEVVGVDTVRDEITYHVVFAIRGRALFYSMLDTLESWFSVRDLSSRRFIQNNLENGRRYYHRHEIHADRGIVVSDDRDTSATTAFPLDEASFFYFVRTLPLEAGRTYEFPHYFRPDRNPVRLTALARQRIEVPAGRFTAIPIRPVFKSRGIFAQGGEAIIWLADDPSRIVLRLRSKLSVGTLTMSLRTSDGTPPAAAPPPPHRPPAPPTPPPNRARPDPSR
jgi:hypothetical protein